MKALTILLSLLISISSFATSTKFVDVYKSERGMFKTITVPMAFDSDSITRRRPNLSFGQIYKVDYVATCYNNKVTDYQKYLNNKRWIMLRSFLRIPDSVEFETNVIYQTKAKNKEEAAALFHGFIMYYGESEEKIRDFTFSYSGSLMEKLYGRKVDSRTDRIVIPKSKLIDSVFTGLMTEREKKDIERALIKDCQVIEWGYDSIGVDKKYHGAYYVLTKVSAGIFAAFTSLTDRSLFDMLKRNRITNRTMIVTDVTGSMGPYFSQLIVWHALKMSQGKKIKHVFFNDGDRKNTNQKKIGETGGIYMTKTNDILEVYRTMNLCMSRGGGGDCPENNFEAVKVGLAEFKNVENVIMLADNWAVPRDGVLLDQIDKPISFVMCGAHFGLNLSYLNLANKNKGEITTVEHSINNLQILKEGDELSLGRNKFIKKKNQFIKG
jgi:hypothetical protein